MVEVTQGRELATALISVERFDADGNFHPDYLAMLDKYRQAGVQQGLDMAAAYLDGFKYNDIVMDGCTMRREWRKDFAAAIRKLGVDDGTD